MLSAGAQLGRYVIEGPLGKGGMGVVYRALDSRLHRHVAIKVLPPEWVADPVRRSRFEREARAVAALSHPGIMAIYDFGCEDGVVYAVMELLEGETLRERLDRGRPAWQETKEFARDVLEALGVAHAQGIIHRDLKPENLFLTRSVQAKILDFGLARREERAESSADTGAKPEATEAFLPTLTEEGMLLGTVPYMSPEQLRGLPLDARSDLFSFGAVLYEMVTGERPFRGRTTPEMMAAILYEAPPAVTPQGNHVPPELLPVLHRCLDKSPDQRFRTAAEVLNALPVTVLQTAAKVDPSAVQAGDLAQIEMVTTEGNDALTVPIERPPLPAEPVRNSPNRYAWYTAIGIVLFMATTSWIFGITFPYWLGVWQEQRLIDEHQWDEVARFWQPPPPDIKAADLFPQQVGSYERVEQDSRNVSDLGIDTYGDRALYHSAFGEVELVVFRVSEKEKQYILEPACTLLRSAPVRQTVGVKELPHISGKYSFVGQKEGRFVTYWIEGSGYPSTQKGVFWYDRGWLFLSRTRGSQDPEAFLKEFLAEISKGGKGPAN